MVCWSVTTALVSAAAVSAGMRTAPTAASPHISWTGECRLQFVGRAALPRRPNIRAKQPAKPARKRLPNNLFTCASTIQFRLQLRPAKL
jgi:hypothetical protein